MSQRHPLSRPWRGQAGSLPLTLLATIVVASISAVLVARVIAGEQQTGFDRAFSEEIHNADAGLQQALYEISSDTTLATLAIGSTASFSDTIGGLEYDVTVERETPRHWTITSVSSDGSGNGPDRSVVATIEEQPFFFPGAFGDDMIAVNGTSTRVDSYNSKQPNTAGVCTLPAAQCAWGTDADFGTMNGTMGTNGAFDFDGNPSIRPGGAFLYDWLDNPGTGITASDPFGDRCDGNPCTYTYVATIPDKLEYDTPEKMEFIDEKFESGGECADTSSPRYAIPSSSRSGETTVIKGPGSGNNTVSTVTSYASHAGMSDPGPSDPTHDAFVNFYCALSLQFYDDINLDSAVDSDNPFVVFVKNSVSQGAPNKRIGCVAPTGSECHSDPSPSANPPRPVADWLQVYVAGLPTTSSGASNVAFRAGGRIAGVYYAPRSGCGSTGSGGLDVYGAIICRSMDNVGNWEFHFDDALGDRGIGQFLVSQWVEGHE